MAPATADGDLANATEVVVNFQEFRPNIAAYDGMTIYFIAAALIMGFLLFLAIRKSVKIGMVQYFHKIPKPQPPGISIIWDVANINAGRLQERHGKRMLERAGVIDIHQQIKEDKKPRKIVLLNRRKGGIYFKNKSTLILGNSRIVKRLGFTPAVYLTSGMGENKRVESPSTTVIRPGQTISVESGDETVVVVESTDGGVKPVTANGNIMDFPKPKIYKGKVKSSDNTSSTESIFLSFARAAVYEDSGLGDSLQQSAKSSSQTLTGSSSGRTYGRKQDTTVRSLRELMHGPMTLKQRTLDREPTKVHENTVVAPKKPAVPTISVLHDYSPVPSPPPSPGLPPPPPLPAASYGTDRLYKKRETPKVSSSGIFMEADRISQTSIHASTQKLNREDDEESIKANSVVQFSDEVSRIDYEYPEESLPRGTRLEPRYSSSSSKDDEEDDEEEEEEEEEDDDEYAYSRYNPRDDRDILGHGGTLPAASEVLESDIVFQEMSVDEEGEQVLFITRL